MIPWRPIVNPVQDGELVDAAVTNRPIQNLADQTRYLKERLGVLDPHAGAVILSNAPLSDGTNGTNLVSVGDFVYYNEQIARFDWALAESALAKNGQYLSTARSFVAGLVINKKSASCGDIVELGQVWLEALHIDPNSLIECPQAGAFVSGRYYLSRKNPGKMTLEPGSPSIQLGYFTPLNGMIQPLQKDLFESHYHYSFWLKPKPASSQNRSGTGATMMGLPPGPQYVDYYNNSTGITLTSCGLTLNNTAVTVSSTAGLSSGMYVVGAGIVLGTTITVAGGAVTLSANATLTGSSTLCFSSAATPPGIQLCIRGNGNAPVSSVRVDIASAGGQLNITVYSGASQSAPLATAGLNYVLTTITANNFPAYGTWISVPGTNLDFAFIYIGTPTGNTLAADLGAAPAGSMWKVFLPNDLSGWTNANPADLTTPSGALFRYLVESQPDLNAVFPPVPVDSALLELNGTSLAPRADYFINQFGVYWVSGQYDGTASQAPWPYDATSGSAKNVRLFFSQSGLGSSDPVVLSLTGQAPVTVTKCPSGEPGTSGRLQIGVDLGLSVGSAAPVDSPTALVGVSGETFALGNCVSRLTPGNGIQIVPTNGGANNGTGALTISASNEQYEGDISSIVLRNAKEVDYQGFPYLAFLPPSSAPSGISATFKLPNLSIPVPFNGLNVFGQFLGEANVTSTGAALQAIFTASYYVIRPGFSLAAQAGNPPAASQTWVVPFPAGYSPFSVLGSEYPDPVSDLIVQPNALAVLTTTPQVVYVGAFAPGDVILVKIDRAPQNGSGLADNYPSRVGIASLRWLIH